MQSKTEWATIGKIVAPFGIHGEMKVFSLSDVPNRFAKLGTVYLGPEHTQYAITGVRPHKGDTLILKLAGVNDPEHVEKLRNYELSIPLSKLAKLPPDSYYQHDIIGLRVFTLDEREVGKITDIMVTGSNDVYVVTPAEGKQILLPAIKEIIKQIDLIRQMMYIEPIGGLLDDNALLDEPENNPREEEKSQARKREDIEEIVHETRDRS